MKMIAERYLKSLGGVFQKHQISAFVGQKKTESFFYCLQVDGSETLRRIKNGSESAVEILQKAEETEQRNQKTISSIRQAQSELANMAALLKNAFSAGLPTSDRMGVSASGA